VGVDREKRPGGVMRTIEDARWHLFCRAIARALVGAPSKVQHVDVEFAEDGRSISGLAYFDDDDDVVPFGWDLATPSRESNFDPQQRDRRRIAAMLQAAAGAGA
jgi:hypothetical protein